MSTLHILSIDKMLERLLSYVPADDTDHIRYLLGGTLQGVIHQELLPAVDGGKRVACEILVATEAVRNTIRRRDGFMLRNIIVTGSKYGMQTMGESIERLRAGEEISEEMADMVMENYQ